MQVITRRNRLPSPDKWRDAIASSGFGIDLAPFGWNQEGTWVHGTFLGRSISLPIALEHGKSEHEPWLEVLTGWKRAIVTTWADGELGQAVQWCVFAVLRQITGGTAAVDGERVPAKAMWAEAQRAYLEARIVLRHLQEQNAVLPWNEPSLDAAETEEIRQRIIADMLKSRRLRVQGTDESGQTFYRLHKLRRQELTKELAT